MKKNIYCEKCGGEITSRDDLVVSNTFLSIVPYHEKCFSKELKGLIYHMPEDVEILLKEEDLMERYKMSMVSRCGAGHQQRGFS